MLVSSDAAAAAAAAGAMVSRLHVYDGWPSVPHPMDGRKEIDDR